MNPDRKIRVLVVDDSAVVRRMISDALGEDPGIEVVGTACDAYVARDKILELNPDVLTLDIEMPRMDGLSFLRILQKHRPMPVVVVSSLTQTGSRAAMEAMELGELREQLALRVKGAAGARLKHFAAPAPAARAAVTSHSTEHFAPRQIVLIGASTGGTEAIKNVLTRLPAGLPGICIVQHIPPVFSKTFADRLNECCAFEVREAVQGDELKPGLALVAPGDQHLTLAWNGAAYHVALQHGPMIHHVRPAVDVMFESAVSSGKNALAVLLTGMGRDGAAGMKKLKLAGAATIAQNEDSCVVYGMPRAAVELGVVDRVLPLDLIPHAILHALKGGAESPPPQRCPAATT